MSDTLSTDVLKHIISFCKPTVAIRLTLCCKSTNLRFVAECVVVLAFRVPDRSYPQEFTINERALQLLVRCIGSADDSFRPSLKRLRVDDNTLCLTHPAFTFEEMNALSGKIDAITSLTLTGGRIQLSLHRLRVSRVEELLVHETSGLSSYTPIYEFFTSKFNNFENLRVLGINSEMPELARRLIDNPLPKLERIRWKFVTFDDFYGLGVLRSLSKAHAPQLKSLEITDPRSTDLFPIMVFQHRDESETTIPPLEITDCDNLELLEQVSLQSFGLPLRGVGGPGPVSSWACLASAYAKTHEIQNLWRLYAVCHPGRAPLEKDLIYLFRTIFKSHDSFVVTKRSLHYCNRLLKQSFNESKVFGTASSRRRVAIAAAYFAEGLTKHCIRRDPPLPFVQRRIKPVIMMIKQLIDDDKRNFNAIVRHGRFHVVKELLRQAKWLLSTGIDVNQCFVLENGSCMPLAFRFVHSHQKALRYLLRIPSFEPICYRDGGNSLLGDCITTYRYGWYWASFFLRTLDSTPRGAEHIQSFLSAMTYRDSYFGRKIVQLVKELFGDKYV